MATNTDEHFEGTYPPAGWAETDASNHLGISTVQAYSGTHSLRVNSAASGAVADMYQFVTGKVWVVRFYVRVAQRVNATSDIFTFTNANGNVYLRLLTTGVIRLTLNATNYAGPTLNNNQWYRIDIRADCTGASMVVDWRVDGAAQTQRSNAQTSANITALTMGIDTTATCDVYFDDLKITDTSGDFPLGAYIIPKSGAAGTLSLAPTITAAGKKGGAGAAGTLTDTPTINRAATKGGKGTGSVSASATMSAAGTHAEPEAHSGAGSMTLSATMAAGGTRYEYELHSGSGALSTSATLAAAGKKSGKGTPTMTLAPSMWGGGTSPPRLALAPTFALTGQHRAPGQGSLGLPAMLTAAGSRTAAGGGTLDVVATLDEIGRHGAFSAPTLALDGTLAADGQRGALGAGAIILSPTVAGAGTQGITGTGTITVSATLTATGVAALKPAKKKTEGGKLVLERLIPLVYRARGAAQPIRLEPSMAASGDLWLWPVLRDGAADELVMAVAVAGSGEAGGYGSETVQLRARQQAALVGLLE